MPILVAARSKAWVCDRQITGIPGSKRAGVMDICIVCLLLVVLV
jgi:hypothetical protein